MSGGILLSLIFSSVIIDVMSFLHSRARSRHRDIRRRRGGGSCLCECARDVVLVSTLDVSVSELCVSSRTKFPTSRSQSYASRVSSRSRLKRSRAHPWNVDGHVTRAYLFEVNIRKRLQL